jgi:hypothetical protein
MKYRKLRIAWSVAWGVLCVLLIALWASSYWTLLYLDTRYYRLQVIVATFPGVLGLNVDTNQTSSGPGTRPQVYWEFQSYPAASRSYGLVTDNLAGKSFLGSRWVHSMGCYETDMPFGMLTFAATATSFVPWLPWRFSLRTLLIGTTVVTAVLGLIVWAAR